HPPHPLPHLRGAPAHSACLPRGRGPPRSAFPTCLDWQSRRSRLRQRVCGPGTPPHSSAPACLPPWDLLQSFRTADRLSGSKRTVTVENHGGNPRRTTMSETTAPDNGVAVITGGASGIGYATAVQLQEAGWKLAVLDIGDEALEFVRQNLGSKPGVRVAKVDVTDEPAVERELAAIENELGPITGVINSAGIAADRHVFDTPIDLFRRILDINVVGTFIVEIGRAHV